MSKRAKSTVIGIELEAGLPAEALFPFYNGGGGRYSLNTPSVSSVIGRLQAHAQKAILKLKMDEGFERPDVGIDGAGDILELRYKVTTVENLIKHRSSYKTIIDYLKNELFLETSHPTAGMHVHLDRDYMDKDSFIRMLKFVQKELIFVGMFSERRHRMLSYCKPDTLTIPDCLKNIEADYSTYGTSDNAIRLNRPEAAKGVHTVEFRLFQSVLDIDKFIANAMFAERLATFCNETEHTRKLNRLEFIDFIKESGVLYSTLMDDIKEKGLDEKILERQEEVETLNEILFD